MVYYSGTYQPGTRTLDEMILDARRLAYQEQYSYTEGWDDNTVSTIFNLGLDKLYNAITQIDNPANIEEILLDVVSQQQNYNLPIQVNMAIRIVDVRYLYGTQNWEFVTLRQGTIQDRFGYPTNIPDTYCIRNGQMLLSPTPNISKPNSLVINYQARMRKLDVRRGLIASYTTGPVTFNLSFAVNSQKDINMHANADSILNKVNYACLVDRYGNPLVNAIPLNSYNEITQVLAADTAYTIPVLEKAALDAVIGAGGFVYVVTGDFSSTNSVLDRACEDYLIEYCVLRLLRLQSAAEPTIAQMETEEAVIQRLINQYRRVRPSVYPVIWQERMRPKSWPFGRRGIY